MNLVDLTSEINDKILALRSRLYGITNVLLDETNSVKACKPSTDKQNVGIGVTSTLEDVLNNLSSMDAVISSIEIKMGAYPPKEESCRAVKYDCVEDVKYVKGVSEFRETSYGQTARIR